MTLPHTVAALRRILTDVQVFDYGVDFNVLWNMEVQEEQVVVVWGDTPADRSVAPVNTEPHLTPFDWAITARTLHGKLRITVLDLREADHNKRSDGARTATSYAALRLVRTLRPESVPWLRRLVVGDVLGTSSADELRALLEAPAQESDVPVTAAKELLGTLPVCRIDLTRESSHHEIANLIAPLVLLRTQVGTAGESGGGPSHREALRQMLAASGFSASRPSSEDAGLRRRQETFRKTLADAGIDGLRLVLCDDQWHHGWFDWICEQTGVTSVAEAIRTAQARGESEPIQVATSENLSIWVSSGPQWLLQKLRDLPDRSGKPLRRRLRLTSATDDAVNEILLLDLRLFAGRGQQESDDFNAKLLETCQGLGSEAAFTAGRLVPDSAEALSLLPRCVALADPLLPIVLFSSTTRRDVVALLNDLPSVVTSFAKPRVLGGNSADLLEGAEDALGNALAMAVAMVRRRCAVNEIYAAKQRVESRVTVTASQGTFRHIGVYIDESGNAAYPNEPFVMAAAIALSPDGYAAAEFRSELAKNSWDKASKATSDELARVKTAEWIANIAAAHGVLLRGAAVIRQDAASFPSAGPLFVGPREWANLALDRTHRVLLRQLITTALVYVVQMRELADGAECEVVADLRSLPIKELGTSEDWLRAFGLTKVIDRGTGALRRNDKGQEVWGLLDPSGVYPVVDEVFVSHQERLGRLRIVGARAAKGSYDGHPMMHWADHLAYAVWQSVRPKRPIQEHWADYLFEGAGLHALYDHSLEHLLKQAPRPTERIITDGHVLEELVAMRARCADREYGGLADRCLALVADRLDQWAW